MLMLSALCVLPLSATEFLQGEFWGELEPFISPEDGFGPPSRESATRRMLEFARNAFSGMIYGYEVFYEPGDPDRGLETRSAVTPRAEVPWGDPALRIRDTRESGSRIYAEFRYDLDESQSNYRSSFMRAATPRANGVGEASMLGGPEAKEQAFERALVDAVHRHARSRYHSRPASIQARVLLQRAPMLGLVDGNYRVAIRALVILDDVRRYEIF